MENLPLPTSLVNCGLTSHMCDICGKKGKIFYIKSYIELSFHISSVLGNYLVYYPQGQREAGTCLVCGL